MQGKTFLVAVFCCVRCILYPGTAICIASKTRGQSVEVLTKIQTILMPNSANLQLEIEPKGITINQSKAEIVFRNTSRIFVVTANDEARHNRANIIICDEFRMIPLDKAKKKEQPSNDYTLPNIISAVCAKHSSLNLLNIWDLTILQLYDQFRRLNVITYESVEGLRWAAWGEDSIELSAWFKDLTNK